MKIDLGKGFDEYARKAQVLPAAIFASPVLIIVAFIADKLAFVGTVIAFCASFGLIYLIAHIVRTRGKKLELTLEKQWGGMPTTVMLRHRTKQNNVLFKRRRGLLEVLIGQKLPTAQQEHRDSDAADDAYIAATKILIAKVRSKRERFPRVSEENANYGFRRNLLALRSTALFLLLVAIAAFMVTGVINGWTWQVASSLVILGGFFLFWLLTVNPDWVLEPGQDYAERLFDALEEGLN